MSDSNRETNWPPVYTTIATDEYQALLAVARAAKKFSDAHPRMSKTPCQGTGTIDAIEIALDALPESIKAEIEKK